MSDATISPATTTTPDRAARRAARYAGYVFWLVFAANFINYVDRYIFTGLLPVIQPQLGFTNFQVGLLASIFLLTYTLVAMPLGFLADRIKRKVIVASGIALWSAATMLTGIFSTFAALIGIKTALGAGQGSYFPASTPMLAAYYRPSTRNQVLARSSVGLLIGIAVGYLLAFPFSYPDVWRTGLLITGAPGLILAVLFLFIREKRRHEEDPPADHVQGEGTTARQRIRAYLRIPTFRAILGMHIFGFFALAGIAFTFPLYIRDTYSRLVYKYDDFGHLVDKAPGPFPHVGLAPGYVPILAGAIIILGGIAGNLYGSSLANRLGRRHAGARVLAGGIGFLLAAPCVIVAIGAHYALPLLPFYASADEATQFALSLGIFAVFALLGAFFLNLYNGPVSAALLDVIPAAERAAAGGTELSLAHLFGDSYVTALIGFLADALGAALGGPQIGLALLLTTPIALVLSGVIGIRGSRHYAADVAALGTTAEAMLGVAATREG